MFLIFVFQKKPCCRLKAYSSSLKNYYKPGYILIIFMIYITYG